QVLKMTFLSLSNALAVWAAYVLVDQSRWVSLTILVAVTAAIDLIYLAPRDAPAEVPRPRDGLPACVPDRPDRLHDRGRPLELLDRPHHLEGRRDPADQDQLAAAAGERQAVRGGTGTRQGRQARPDPARRHERRRLHRHERRARAAPEELGQGRSRL